MGNSFSNYAIFPHQFAWQLYSAIVKNLPHEVTICNAPMRGDIKCKLIVSAVSSSMKGGIENWTLLCSCWGYTVTGDAQALQKSVLLILSLTFAWDLIPAKKAAWQSVSDYDSQRMRDFQKDLAWCVKCQCKNSPSDPENKETLSL